MTDAAAGKSDAAAGKSCSVNALGNTSATIERAPEPFRSEDQLEADIQATYERLCSAPEWDEKPRHWREMVRLIDLRTPSRRRFMERMQGLR